MILPYKPRILTPVPTSGDAAYNQRSWKQYAQAISGAGGVPVEVPFPLDRDALRAELKSSDGVCLPGSPADVDPDRYGAERQAESAAADPAREELDFLLLDWAAREAKPVLGICFGLQSLNTWTGGTLVQDLQILPVNHSAGASVAVAHSVLITANSEFAALLDAGEVTVEGDFLRLPVNSSHHQALAIAGRGLRVVARCPEDGVIEAVERAWEDEHRIGMPTWLLGVQWHPERSTSTSAASRAIFQKLIDEAAASRTAAVSR